jgi:hypothetical protein
MNSLHSTAKSPEFLVRIPIKFLISTKAIIVGCQDGSVHFYQGPVIHDLPQGRNETERRCFFLK